MANQGKKRSSSGNGGKEVGFSQSSIVQLSKRAASDTAFVTKKLLCSTGKAAWIVGTTFIILVVPLMIQMDREQLFNDIELQQASLLGTPSPPALN